MTTPTPHDPGDEARALLALEQDLTSSLERHQRLHEAAGAPRFARWLLVNALAHLLLQHLQAAIAIEGVRARVEALRIVGYLRAQIVSATETIQ